MRISAWQKRDYAEAVEGIRQGYEDMKAGRTVPAEQVFDDMRRKHGFPDYPPRLKQELSG